MKNLIKMNWKVLWWMCLLLNVVCSREWVSIISLMVCLNNIREWVGFGNKCYFFDRKLDNKFVK